MFTLGIDIGTTSVKVVLTQQDNLGFAKVLHAKNQRHEADIHQEQYPTYFEQDTEKICCALQNCVKMIFTEIESDNVIKVEHISICGQMHGCVLWNPVDDNLFYPCSTLITWQDQRCSSDFMKSLPQPEKSIPLSTGFGCATLLWLKNNKPEILQKYQCAGTIMDYVIASICKLAKPVMSLQNAMSWGYYNFEDKAWNLRILKDHGFPIQYLPDLEDSATIVGTLSQEWCSIPKSTKVFVGLGDMQCSALSCNPKLYTGVFNLGTSAQLSTVVPKDKVKHYYKFNSESILPRSVICVPYFGDYCLLTAASLNGGAVYEMFVRALYDWTKQFVPTLTFDDIYLKLEATKFKETANTNIRIKPTVYGERHAPDLKASIENIGSTNITFKLVASELARSIIRNVFDMFNDGSNEHFGKLKTILACGTAFEKNELFRHALKEISNCDCQFGVSADAAFGATLVLNGSNSS